MEDLIEGQGAAASICCRQEEAEGLELKSLNSNSRKIGMREDGDYWEALKKMMHRLHLSILRLSVDATVAIVAEEYLSEEASKQDQSMIFFSHRVNECH